MVEGPYRTKVTRTAIESVNPRAEVMIIPLWRRGCNTFEIAKELGLPECEIANRLLRLRMESRR